MKRWVIKAGSKMVCEGGPLLLRTWMLQVAELRKKYQIEIIWVTSGAIATAIERTNFKTANSARRTLPQKQALSAIGQPLIMDQYNLALQACRLLGSQVLLTAGDMEDPTRRRNLQNTLNELLMWKAIPILNENDAVATEEIQFGDNDNLAAQVAIMMKAERLILMTDVEGLYNQDPKKNKKALLIPYLPCVGDSELAMAHGKSKSTQGTGGMYSKLLAADLANQHRIVTHLIRGDLPKNLLNIALSNSSNLPNSIGTQIGGKLDSK